MVMTEHRPAPGMTMTQGVVTSNWTNYGPKDINADIPDNEFIYAPKSSQEQMMIAAKMLPQQLGTPNAYVQKTMAAARLVEEIRHERGMMGKAKLVEALNQADFNYIMADTIYRELVKGYGTPDSPMMVIADSKTVPTPGRPVKLFQMMGLASPLNLMNPGEVPQARYPQDTGMAITVNKYGADVYLLWEVMQEDDLGGLRDIPNRLSQAVKATEGRSMTMLYADSDGFWDDQGGPFYVTNNDRVLNPSLAAATAKGIPNKLTANPEMRTPAEGRLTMLAIQAARTQMSKLLSPIDGNPISTKVVHLVVGVGLAEQAQNILNAQSYTTEAIGAGGLQAASGDQNGMFRMTGSMKSISGIQLHVDPYLHTIVNGSRADTMWMLVADKDASFSPFYWSKLKGYEMPAMQRQLPRWQPMNGATNSFDDRISLGFRVIHLFGSEWGDPRSVIASDGSA